MPFCESPNNIVRWQARKQLATMIFGNDTGSIALFVYATSTFWYQSYDDRIIATIVHFEVSMTIQAITIDFWNTLYDSSGGEGREMERGRVVLEQAHRLGVGLTHDMLKAAQQQAWKHFNRVWREEQRTPQTRTMVEFFWQALGVRADAQAVEAVTTVFCEGVLAHPPKLLPKVKEVLSELTSTHRIGHIALISDTAFSPGRVLKQLMERDGVAEYFSAFSFSDETGVSKPHPHAYTIALAGVDVPLERCVHIGDIERTDIVGAKALGMKAILFAGDPNGQMNAEHQDKPTQADCRADSWEEVLEALRQMG
jgi:putative hydrolase of the HAD superfamily